MAVLPKDEYLELRETAGSYSVTEGLVGDLLDTIDALRADRGRWRLLAEHCYDGVSPSRALLAARNKAVP